MRVAVDVLGPLDAPYQYARDEDSLGLSLRRGFIEMGLRRTTIGKVIREAGHLQLCTRHSEKWFGSADLQLLTIGVSRAALATAFATTNAPELRLIDERMQRSAIVYGCTPSDRFGRLSL